MKNKIDVVCIIVQIILVCNISMLSAQKSQNLDSVKTHIRKGYVDWGNGYHRDFIFNNPDENIDYYFLFPVVESKQIITKEIQEVLNIDFRTYNSVEAAELAIVELLEMSALGMYNMIDSLLPNGQIGDNCWHNLRYGVILFIRNNVFVKLGAQYANIPDIGETAELLARKLDSMIIESEKIKDYNQLFAPEIQSFNITSELPGKWEDIVKFKINAIDPNASQLYYRRYSVGLSIVSKTGEISTKLYKSLDGTLDSTKAIVKVWIWNENHVYTLHYQEIPF